MSRMNQSLIWAGVIIAAALLCVSQGLSDGASFGIIAGLTGAAVGAVRSGGGGRKCSL
ncbi:MAG: hypothetical protein ACX930_13995 [Erythrobacter sp.]